jgi:hypothetical protein
VRPSGFREEVIDHLAGLMRLQVFQADGAEHLQRGRLQVVVAEADVASGGVQHPHLRLANRH